MKLPRRPTAVIFDMDGLLFDTEALYQEAIMVAAAERGHEVTAAVFSRMIGGVLGSRVGTCSWGHFGSTFPVDEFMVAWLTALRL